MAMRIGRTYRFEAAHFLPKLPDEHKCRHMHGHNYRVEVVVSGGMDERGFVEDFAELDKEVLPLIAMLDHKTLNEVEGLSNPTAEILAQWFYYRIDVAPCARVSVRVWENDDCWAQYGEG